MSTRKGRASSPEEIKNIAHDISHRFHLLEESLERIDKRKIPAKELVKDIENIRKGFSSLEGADKKGTEKSQTLVELNEKINKMEKTASALSDDGSYTLEAAHKLLNEIKEAAADIPDIAKVLNIPTRSIARAPDKLEPLVKLKETPFSAVTNTRKNMFSNMAVPIDVSIKDGQFKVEERPFIEKVRIKASVKDTGKPGNSLPLTIKSITKSGEKSIIGSGVTNRSGYLSVDMAKMELSSTDKIEISADDNYSISVPVEYIIKHPIKFNIPELIAQKIQEKPKDFIAIDSPDAEDLVNDPDAFSFDTYGEDGSACIKARPEISVRNFNFSQLVRGEESDLIEQDGEDATIRAREAVTAPIPVRPNNNIGANLSVVGGRIITGKVINYRQFWQPAAQGLGKLLYSLALAPREEIKIAIMDWRRSEYAKRQDNIGMRESLDAEINRDTTVSDIVTGKIEEEISGGSDGGSTTEANNKPGWGSYLGGALVGAVLGGPVGVGLGVAAAHYVRPDTGADSDASIDSWNNAVRNISAKAIHTASDSVTQRASAVRDLHSTVVNATEVTEQENVRTRTVRNQNQHHSLTIQYYQVLAHYRVVTEALSEEDVLLVPYAIDHDVFADLPNYQKFIINTKSYTITQFCLRHNHAIRNVLPRKLNQGMDALLRLAHDSDSYEVPKVTASRWTLLSNKELGEGIDVYLDTKHGFVPLRPIDQSKSVFTSSEVSLENIRGIHFRLDFDRYFQNKFGTLLGGVLGELFGGTIENHLEGLKVVYSNIELNAHITKTRYIRSNMSVYTLNSRGEISLGLDNSNGTLNLDAFSSDHLNSLLNTKITPRGEDYEAVEAMVNWMHHNPMTVMSSIWMTEDPNERALRFDRLSYNGNSLLNIIENKPLGVDGNYVAFRLAPSLRVLPPIDLSSIGRQSTVVSVPTSGVFAETYLSCNNASEKRDITREVDNTKAVPFGAPDIAPITTGNRRGVDIPQPPSLPSPVINFQNVPNAPSSAIDDTLKGLTASSPFPDLSYGAETMETIRTLADTAMKVDGEKQKEILNTITELSKIAADTAKAAAGIPSGSSDSDSGGGSGKGDASNKDRTESKSSGDKNSSNAKHKAQEGQNVRQSDPASNYDHIKVVEEAEATGKLTSDKAREAIENIVGATSDTPSSSKSNDSDSNIKFPSEMPNMLNKAIQSSIWILVGIVYFPTRLPDDDMNADVLDHNDSVLIENIRNHALFNDLDYKITGYTDSRPDRFGNPNFNDELSFRRASIIAHELFPQDSDFPLYNEEGMLNERIQLIQAGVDTNATPGDNQRARRAEIWAMQSEVVEEDD